LKHPEGLKGLGTGAALGAGIGAVAHRKKVGKAYQSGTITVHAEQARMHGRKKNSGYRQAAAGAVVGGGGVALHQNPGHAARFIAEQTVKPKPHPDTWRRLETHGREVTARTAKLTPKLRTAGKGAA